MGAIVATLVHNPVLAVPLAFASHFALDAIPHFDYPTHDQIDQRFFMWLAADAGLAASILAAIFFLQPSGVTLILLCAIVAASPDLMWLYYLVYKRGQNKAKWPWIVKFHSRIQSSSSTFWPIELLWLLITGAYLATRLV